MSSVKFARANIIFELLHSYCQYYHFQRQAKKMTMLLLLLPGDMEHFDRMLLFEGEDDISIVECTHKTILRLRV